MHIIKFVPVSTYTRTISTEAPRKYSMYERYSMHITYYVYTVLYSILSQSGKAHDVIIVHTQMTRFPLGRMTCRPPEVSCWPPFIQLMRTCCTE